MSSLTLTGAGPEAGGAAFTPASLPNLAAWYKADAGTSTTTDGVAISQWNDQSGNARHLTQATGSLQPLYKAAIQNGLPVVRFDGVDDFLRATFTLNQPAYVFAVLIYRAAFVSNAAALSGSGGVSGSLLRTSATVLQIYCGLLADSITTTPQAWHVYGMQFSGVTSELRADGGTATVGDSGAGNPAGITLGADGTNAQPAAVDVGEVVALSAAPSAGDRTSTESYLKTRWATP